MTNADEYRLAWHQSLPAELHQDLIRSTDEASFDFTGSAKVFMELQERSALGLRKPGKYDSRGTSKPGVS